MSAAATLVVAVIVLLAGTAALARFDVLFSPRITILKVVIALWSAILAAFTVVSMLNASSGVVFSTLAVLIAAMGMLLFLMAAYFWLLDHTFLGRTNELLLSLKPFAAEAFRRNPLMSVLGALILPKRFFAATDGASADGIDTDSQSLASPGEELRTRVVGANGEVLLFSDHLEIRRRGLATLITHGSRRHSYISLRNLRSVDFLDSTSIVSGYIRFCTKGENGSFGGLSSAIWDRNAVLFRPKQRVAFQELRVEVEKQIAGAADTQTLTPN